MYRVSTRGKLLAPAVLALILASQTTAWALGQQCIGCQAQPAPVAIRNHIPASSLLAEPATILEVPHPAPSTQTPVRGSPQVAPEAGGPSSGFGIWDCIASHESGGNWGDRSGGFEGGLQFLNSTWLAAGGGRYAQHAYDASPAQQVEIARSWLARTSWGQWPNTSRLCGVR